MENNENKIATTTDHSVTNYRGVKAMPFIIGNETFERLGTLGILANLTVYLTHVFHMKNITAATLVNIFNGTSNMAPLLGAFLSDSYFGRYKTLAFSSVSSLLGMIVMTLTAAIHNLHPPECSGKESTACIGPTTWQSVFLVTGFGFLVIGAGGIRPCNLAFGADQFNPETESGRKGINSFFNWYYFTYTFAVMVSVTVIVYVQSNMSWAIGLGIPAFLMLLACLLFFAGSRLFVKVRPEGSPLTRVAQVFVAAAKKRRLKIPDDPSACLYNYMPSDSINCKLPYTSQFLFLDKAAIRIANDHIGPNGSAANPWDLCGMQQVEEVKCVIRVIPIWASAIIYFVAVVQQYTYAIFQAIQSDRSLGTKNFNVPAATYTIFSMLSLTAWIPIYDRMVIPFLRKTTGNESGITLLQRISIGLILSILTMLVSGLVESKRRTLALTRTTIGVSEKGGAVSCMSSFWLVPQLTLTGLTEAFGSIGQIEFFYKQFPENMRSTAGSFFFAGIACSSYLSGFLVSVVHHISEKTEGGDWLAEDLNKAKLDYFYFMIAGLGVLNFGYFLVCAKWYRYKGEGDDNGTDELQLARGTRQSEKHFV